MRGVCVFVAAALAVAPALAGDVQLNGRTVTVSDQADETILKMTSSNYALNKSRDEIITDARACLANTPGLTLGTVNAEAGTIEATQATEYRARFANYRVSSKLTLTAEDRVFWLTDAPIEVTQLDTEGAPMIAPLSKQNSGWDKGLMQFIQNEDKLVDCLFK